MSEEDCNDRQIETNGNDHEHQRDIVEIHVRKHNDRNHDEVVHAKWKDQQFLMRETGGKATDTKGCAYREDDRDDIGSDSDDVHGECFVDVIFAFFLS